MSMFSKIAGLLGGLLLKLGPLEQLVPIILSQVKTKMNSEDVEGTRALGVAIKDFGALWMDVGDAIVESVDPDGPGGKDITGTEYTDFAAKVVKLGDGVPVIVNKIKSL